MRRRCSLALARVAGSLGAARPAAADAHPLGNFSVNHLDRGRRSPSDRVDVRYVLDQAEIPTFQERGLAAGRGARAQARRGRARAAR